MWGHRLLRTLAMVLGVMNLTSSATIAIVVLFAGDRLGLGSVGFGVLLSSLAVGGLLGALAAERVVGWLGAGATMRVGLAIEASTTGVIALSHSAYVVGAVLALFGFHAMVWNVRTISLRQAMVPGRLLGRVGSSYPTIAVGGGSAGALVGGLVARNLGLAAPFWAGCALMALTALLVRRVVSNRAVAELAAPEDA